MNTQSIIKMYVEEQRPIVEVAKAHGIAPKTAKKILLENGFEIRSKNATREKALTQEQLEDLYVRQKMSCADIAKYLGIAHGTVHNYLKKYGLNQRSVAQAKASDSYTLWDAARLEKCRLLLLEHKEYQVVADLLGCSASAVENKNRENWQIPMSIWVERNDEIRECLEKTRNYADTAFKFNISEQALWHKNQKSWHIDLSMNSTLFGIPTQYNGTLYRSKKEAIIAQYLTERQISFEYEKKVKQDHGWTCDFYLSTYDLWIEYDGLESSREQTKSVPYNRDNPKVRFYQENGYRHMILGKRTWQKQLDGFFATNSVL